MYCLMAAGSSKACHTRSGGALIVIEDRAMKSAVFGLMTAHS
jgi:hypothetical protein